MADYNVNLSAPQGAGASPVAPVQEQLNPFFALAENVIDAFGKNAAADRKAQAEAAKQATLSDYSQKIGAIEDGLLSGELDPSKANLMRRKVHSQYAASYPQYIKEIKEINSSFKEGGAIGEAMEEEQAQQDLDRKIMAKAADRGLVVPKGADITVKEAVKNAQLANDRFDDALKRESEVQRYRVAVKSEQREDEKIQADRDLDVMLTEVGSQNLNAFNKIVEMGVRNAWEGRDISDIQLNLQQYLGNVRQTVNIIARNNPQKAQAFMKLFEDGAEILKNAPTAAREQTDNQLKDLINRRALLLISNDAEAQNLAAGNKLGIDPKVYGAAELKVVERVLHFAAKPTTPGSMEIASNPSSMGTAVKVFNNSYEKPTDKEGDVQKVNTARGILRSMALSTNVPDMDSTKFNAATDFLTSKGFKELWDSGKIEASEVAGAERAYQKLYALPVSLAIQQKLTQGTYTPQARYGIEQPTGRPGGPSNPMLQSPRAISPEPRPYSDFVEYQMIGESLVARPKITEGHPLDVRDSQRISEDLRSTTEYLNKLVDIGTTLTRSPTKQAFWEMHKHELLPDIYPDPQRVKAGQVYEMDGKKFKYKGGYPWKNPNQWEEVKDGSPQ